MTPESWMFLREFRKDLEPERTARVWRDGLSLPPPPPSSAAWLLRRLVSEDLSWLPPHLEARVRRARRPVIWQLTQRTARDAVAEIRRRVRRREAPLEVILTDAVRAARDLALIALRRPSAPRAASRLHQMTQRLVAMPR